jgi:enoyl-[acyl-carrier-protein] reductase (NADH)
MEGLRCLEQGPIDAVLPGAEDVIPLGFIPEPADYGQTFVYLASGMAGVVTGECVWADSGFGIRGIGSPAGGRDLTWEGTRIDDQALRAAR